MSRTLSSRLTYWYVGSLFIFLGISFGITWLLVSHLFDTTVEKELIEDLSEFREIYVETGIPGVIAEIAKESSSEDASTEFIRLLAQDGSVIAATDLAVFSNFEHQSSSPPKNSGYFLNRTERLLSEKDTGDSENRGFTEIYGTLGEGLAMHIGEYPQANDETLSILRTAFLLTLLFSIPLAIVISKLAVRKSISSISKITATAEKIRLGYLDERVDTYSTDIEIATLESTFNTMLDRIRELVAEIREMTDNIAHDLKSPLARIRFMSEVALSKTISKNEQDASAVQTIEECDRLIKMIDMALDVAEAQAGIKSHRDTNMDFSALVVSAVELFEPVAEQRGIEIVTRIASGCVYFGGLENMQRTVSNLIDNAIKYSDKGGTVTVSLEFDSEDLNLVVSDTGIGIKNDELESIFKRFYRCDRTRSAEGCGLGLSYCRAIVRRAGGNILANSVLGKGSKFTLRLPLNHMTMSRSSNSVGVIRETEEFHPATNIVAGG